MSGCPTCGSTQTELNGNDYESIYHCPDCGTVETIPYMREYGERKTYAPSVVADRDGLLVALKAARGELNWWIENHGCCKGHENETGAMDTIAAALAGR